MTKNKSTKRALLLSALSLLMCVSMLVGSTFAWFTDSVTSGKNKIVAGNLDIEVYYAYPSDVVNGDIPASAWKKMEADKPVFNPDALWEPGYTEVVFFKFANEGSLELQYQLNVDILKETPGTNVMGEEFLLSNHIMAYINNTFEWNYKPALSTNREDATNPAGAPNPYYDTLNNAANYAPCRADSYTENPLSLDSWQTLHANENTYATMVLWMPTSVGNEANHKTGTEAPQIDLGISVVATQYTHEKDSFDNQYDKDAFIYASTPDEIFNAVKNAKDGDTVYIKSGTYEMRGDQNLQIENKSISVIGIGKVDLVFTTASTAKKVYIYNNSNNPMTVNLENLHLDGKNLAKNDAGFWVRSNSGDITANIKNCSSKDFGWDEVQIDNGYSAGAKVVVNLTDVTAQVASMNALETNRSEINLFGSCNIGLVKKDGNYPENMYINGDNGVTKVVGISTAEELTAQTKEAADGTTFMLLNDITGDATAKQMPNIDVVIDGNGHTLTGHLYIDGRSAASSPETLTIKNLHITSDYYVANGEYALINAYYEPTSGNGATRNIHNVTIEDCTFTVTGAAKHIAPAIDLYQPFNVKVIDCVVTGAHSVLQNKGGEVIYVEKVTATDCKNGISFGTNTKATIKNCHIKSVGAGGYGIRTDASAAYSLTVEDCKIEAFVPVLARKMTGNNYSAAFAGTNNVLSATNTYGYQVVLTETDWDNDSAAPKAPTGTYTLTGADSFAVFPAN